MARALFHKNQRVYVRPVGTWGVIEKVIPQWVRGVEEPLRVTYDVGLGREFSAAELVAESQIAAPRGEAALDNWRLLRAPNREHGDLESQSHPVPGTYPIVVTDDRDWGGWRVPCAEYSRDPNRIEAQARLIVQGPALLEVLRKMSELINEAGDTVPANLREQNEHFVKILRRIHGLADRAPNEVATLAANHELDDKPYVSPLLREPPKDLPTPRHRQAHGSDQDA